MQESRRREIRIKSAEFREKCKVSQYGIINLFKDCERLGYKIIRYPVGLEAELGFFTQIDDDLIIHTNTSSRLSRELFTLAHEIGHSILHVQKGKTFVDDNATIYGANIDEKEQEANYFAACLLMPEDEIRRFIDLKLTSKEMSHISAMDIARMMSVFSVSFDMVLNRLENLGIITSDDRYHLDGEKNEKRVGNLLRSVGGNYSLNQPSEIIDIPFEYIDYVIFNYNHGIIPRETLEEVLKCYHLSSEDIEDRLVERNDELSISLDDMIGGLKD